MDINSSMERRRVRLGMMMMLCCVFFGIPKFRFPKIRKPFGYQKIRKPFGYQKIRKPSGMPKDTKTFWIQKIRKPFGSSFPRKQQSGVQANRDSAPVLKPQTTDRCRQEKFKPRRRHSYLSRILTTVGYSSDPFCFRLSY
jgi:hypothetical protein